MDHNTPESTLLEELRKGNANACTEIYQRYHKRVSIMAQYITNDIEETKDITQNVFADLWNDRMSKKVKKSLRNYLITMARNKSIDVLKSKATKKKHIHQHLYLQAILEIPINKMDLLYYTKCINIILETKCAEIDRAAFKYYHQYYMTYEEVADKLGTTISNARSYVSKAMKVVKQNLKKHH